MPEKNARRKRQRRRSPGLVAVSAVLLAASAASATVRDGEASVEPTPAATPAADGNTPPDETFPVAESHLASGHVVGAASAPATSHVPATVLAAYQRAHERVNRAQPRCHLPLELLAAIGKVESGHARGGRVDATGRAVTPILGPVLNGGAYAAIADTDDGSLDGDPVWDRAVGPMQFIPGTWARWASDGNADDTRDPHNIYDASLSAARYLCAAGRDLSTPAGLDEAVLSYNHSTSYLSLVRAWMLVYRDGVVPVDDILLPLAGGLPVDAATTPSPVALPSPPPAVTPSATPPTSSPPPDLPSDPSSQTSSEEPPTEPATPTTPQPPTPQPPTTASTTQEPSASEPDTLVP